MSVRNRYTGTRDRAVLRAVVAGRCEYAAGTLLVGGRALPAAA